jgi:hypothetical protein
MKDASHIAETYARLALAIDRHQPGYLDAYHGPAEWKAQAAAGAPRPLDELAREAAALAAAVAQSDMDAARRDFLAAQVRAMQMSLRLLAGEPVPFTDEVEALYDITPQWTDETRFDEAHRVLEELLPPGGSLAERRDAWRKQTEVSVEQARAVFPMIIERLRSLTRARFPLPPGEDFELAFVSNHPWSAYNWYQGGYRSRIEINTDLPLRATNLAGLIAHEGYPHHTEAVSRRRAWSWPTVDRARPGDHFNCRSVIAEGIATRALDAADRRGATAWHAGGVVPRLFCARRRASAHDRARFRRPDGVGAMPRSAARARHERDEGSPTCGAMGCARERSASRPTSFRPAQSLVHLHLPGRRRCRRAPMLRAASASTGSRWFSELRPPSAARGRRQQVRHDAGASARVVAPSRSRVLPGCEGEKSGIDLALLDADIAGCVSTFLHNHGKLDDQRRAILRQCRAEIDPVVAALDGEARAYYARLLRAAGRAGRCGAEHLAASGNQHPRYASRSPASSVPDPQPGAQRSSARAVR